MSDLPRLVTIVLEVSDLDRSVALYREGFGLDLHVGDHEGGEHGPGDRWTSGRHAAMSWPEGEFLHFALYEAAHEPTTRAQVAFRVEDLAEAHRRALRSGAAVVHGPRREPWGMSARYRDPDGNVVELTEPTGSYA